MLGQPTDSTPVNTSTGTAVMKAQRGSAVLGLDLLYVVMFIGFLQS